MDKRMISKMRGGIVRRGVVKPCEPLEQEVARMKRERMPVKGGATPVYGDENGEVGLECDYKSSPLDRARREMSYVARDLELEKRGAEVKSDMGDSEAGEE